MTISALSIWTITEFMSDILELRKHSNSRQFHMSVNILRYPSFQNINVLPTELKLAQAEKISTWLTTASGLSEFERNQIERLVTYLRTVDRSYEDTDSQESKLKDFVAFTKEYAARRNKNISTVFPAEFNDWFTAQ